jgi:hypothetical protein
VVAMAGIPVNGSEADSSEAEDSSRVRRCMVIGLDGATGFEGAIGFQGAISFEGAIVFEGAVGFEGAVTARRQDPGCRRTRRRGVAVRYSR